MRGDNGIIKIEKIFLSFVSRQKKETKKKSKHLVFDLTA